MNLKMVAVSMAALFCLVTASAPVRAQLAPGAGDPFTLMFDENGNGSIDNRDGNGFQPLVGVLAPDPTNGGAPALTYLLPSAIGEGDIAILDADGNVSDAMRFTNIGGPRLLYYSDNSPGDTALADTGFPRNLSTGFHINEIDGGFSYFSGGARGVNNDYIGISDEASAVPEPGTWAFMSTGIAGLVMVLRRKR